MASAAPGTIGYRVREARLAAGLTQEKLAMKVGAARRRVIAWESGENLPSLHYLRAIAHATDASVDELAGTDSDDEEAAQVAAATNDFIAAIDRMLQERLELLLRDKVTA